MKQVLQNLRSGETIVAEVPVPDVKPGMLLVKTATSLVSAGTERMLVEFAGKSLVGKARSRPDLARQVLDKARREGLLTTIEAAFSRLDQPMPLGYSSAGTIAAVGDGVTGFKVGNRVACAGGGYAVHAEFALVPKNLLTTLPENVDFESGSFTTLCAIALHGFRLAEAQLGESIAVIGLGLLGLLTTGIACAAGCRVLGVDIDPQRVSLAQAMGGEGVLRAQAEEAAQFFSRGRGCDAVLICADTPDADPVELAGAVARDRARIVAIGAVGLNLPRKIYYEKELFFINSRSYGPGRYDPDYEEGGQDYPLGYVRWTEGRNLEAVVDLLAGNRLDVKTLISHRFQVDDALQAYELITGKRQEPFLGVLLTFGGELQPPLVTNGISARAGEKPEPESQVRSIPTAKTSPLGKDRLSLGVLGAGNFATAMLLPAIRKIPEVKLAGIVSASGLNARHAASRFSFGYADSDETRILNDPNIDAVAVLTRHHLHARQTLAGLRAGKHVFCEKPLTLTEEELDEIEAYMLTGDIQSATPQPFLTVGYNRRFAPLAKQLSEFLADRQEPLAASYRVNAGYLPPDHWLHDPQQGGGRIIGEACHFIDFLTFLVGQPPVSISARGLPDAGRYREDNVFITLIYPDGSIGSLSYLANGDKAFPKERVEVFCGGRAAALDDYRSLEMVQKGKRERVVSRMSQDKGHRAEWEHFAQTILKGGPAPIPYDQLIGVSRATFAAVKSLRSGARVAVYAEH
jgi:predicted dehydrogenase/threonine dehydrogenase-like Zn-dependent dehydrogenase